MIDESLVAYFENAIIDALEKGNPDFKVFIPKPQKDLFGKSQPTQGKLVAKKIVVNEEERSELNKNLHTLISYENHENPFTDNKEVNLLLNAIDNIKILDPACGSGAFPMGVLQKLVYVLGKLDPENLHWKEQQEKRAEKEKEEKIKKLESDIETVQKLSQEEVKKMAIEELEKRKEEIRHAKEHNDPDYLRKLYLIRNCIYGVDIQPIAVQISKLRFFISLLIEQNINESLPNNGIQALPNLETKFVAADTLVGVDRPGQGNVAYMLTGKLEEQLKMVREQHFNPHTRKEKLELQRKDKTIREKIASELKTHGWDEETADKLAKWDIYNQNEHADFFDKDWMFGIKDGFDVVLGNPPFIEHKKIKNAVKKIKNSYEAYSGTADLYVYFYEKGTKLLNKKGSLCLISSNKFLKTVYGKNLRRFLLKHKVCQLIDFSDVHVFDALVASSIILVNNSKAENNKIVAISIGDDFANYSNLNQYIEKRHFLINQSTLSEKTWLLENGDNLKIKLHIDNFSKRINEFENISIYRGITTGYNPAYIIDKNTREKLINNDSNNANIIYPLLQGRNIKKWVYAYSDNYLIFVPWHFPLHEDKSINGASEKAEKEFARQYSPLYNYLLSFKKELSNRNKEETGIRYEWYALQRCANTYYPEFEKEKIVWGLTADKWAFAYDNQKHFLPSNGYILTSEVIPIKYILALLNSDLMKFYFSFEGIMTAGGAYTLKHGTINELPLYDANEEIHNMLISLVDYILFCLNGDDIINSVPNEHLAQFFESVINGCVYELYFEEHMKEKEIDILQFVQADVLPIEGKSETEKAGIIKQVYEKWREHKSPVRNRLLLFASRSEIISKIENGG